ncbi:unnamed protein product [Paramecium sonneborni]|uniref:Uncharacterized protein n=1 Tax=Paramecium sonneborni TaxID=65129 RepID=A0A8S1QX27_9CILI|nr:unnamed protein product [Paramecium sonneborni]
MNNQSQEEQHFINPKYDEQIYMDDESEYMEPQLELFLESTPADYNLKGISQQETKKIGITKEFQKKRDIQKGIQSASKKINKSTKKLNKNTPKIEETQENQNSIENYVQKQYLNMSVKIFSELDEELRGEFTSITEEKDQKWPTLICCNQIIFGQCYESLDPKPTIVYLKKLKYNAESVNFKFRIKQFREICLAAKVDYQATQQFKDKDQKDNYERNLQTIESKLQEPKNQEEKELKDYISAFREFILTVIALKENKHIKRKITLNQDDFINLAKNRNMSKRLEQVFNMIENPQSNFKTIFQEIQPNEKNQYKDLNNKMQYYEQYIKKFRKKITEKRNTDKNDIEQFQQQVETLEQSEEDEKFFDYSPPRENFEE